MCVWWRVGWRERVLDKKTVTGGHFRGEVEATGVRKLPGICEVDPCEDC